MGSRYDQPDDDSWRDKISRAPYRTCNRCGKQERDSDPEYLVTFLCEDCVRELWAHMPVRTRGANK